MPSATPAIVNALQTTPCASWAAIGAGQASVSAHPQPKIAAPMTWRRAGGLEVHAMRSPVSSARPDVPQQPHADEATATAVAIALREYGKRPGDARLASASRELTASSLRVP